MYRDGRSDKYLQQWYNNLTSSFNTCHCCSSRNEDNAAKKKIDLAK